MKSRISSCGTRVAACAGLGVFALSLVVNAAPKAVNLPDDYLIKKGAKKEGPIVRGIVWLDEATRSRGGSLAC